MAREIDNFEDVIDSRDVIERIEELKGELEEFWGGGPLADFHEYVNIAAADPGHPLYAEAAEYKGLKDLAEQAEGYGDWEYGAQLIRGSYFTDYAQQLAEDIGAVDANATWPNNCIDWERAARELEQDYSLVDFDGVTYLIRS